MAGREGKGREEKRREGRKEVKGSSSREDGRGS